VRDPDLVGSGRPRPNHFRARNEAFQSLAAPFPSPPGRPVFAPCSIRGHIYAQLIDEQIVLK
jgi:hypothetical protein